AHNRLVLCNSNFQELHNLPDEAIAAGASYEAVVAAGRKPVVRSKITSEGQIPGARTFEAQLDDGRWLHISERRTKDGGYVSVGTDITNIKLHEEKLMDSEKRLMATVADLRHSQQKLERQAEEVADLAEKYAEEIEREPFLNDAMRVVSGRANDKRLKLTARLGRGIRLTADHRLLKQIVLNLLSNAVKFTPEGGRVTIRARATSGWVSISIAD